MRKLYEIEQDIANLIEVGADRFVDGETGEIISKEDFDALQMEWSAKVEGIALGYKNEDAEAKAIKEEIDKLTERMNRHKRKAEGYKNFLAMVLEGKKFETAKALVKPTKSKVCEWDGSFEGLEKYAIPQEPKFDKAQARKDLLAGVEVPHCTLVEKTSVSIK